MLLFGVVAGERAAPGVEELLCRNWGKEGEGGDEDEEGGGGLAGANCGTHNCIWHMVGFFARLIGC